MQVLIRVGTRCDRSIVDDYEFAVVPLLCILKGGRGGRGDIDELIMSARFSQKGIEGDGSKNKMADGQLKPRRRRHGRVTKSNTCDRHNFGCV